MPQAQRLLIVKPAEAVGAGNECDATRTIVLHVSNVGSAASPPLADPIGAKLTGGPFSGHAGLPPIAPGATTALTFTVTTSLTSPGANDMPDSSELKGARRRHIRARRPRTQSSGIRFRSRFMWCSIHRMRSGHSRRPLKFPRPP